MSDIKTLIDGLDDDFGYWIWTTNVVDEETVAECEAEIGIPFPADYKAFVLAHGCTAVLAKPEVWPRPVAYAVGPQWAFDYGFEIYGIADEIPEPLDVAERRETLVEEGIEDLLPVAGYMARSHVLACDARGQFYWVRHGEREPVAGTFSSIIGELFTQLASDKDRAKAAGSSLWS